jgi:hypothetical protein
MSGRPIIFPACARSRESEAGIRALEAVRREPCKGSRKPCAGSRLRQAGSRAPEIVHRTPCNGGKPYAGSRAREAVRRNPGAKSRAPKRAPEAGRRKLGAGSRAPEAGRRKPGAGSRAPDTRCLCRVSLRSLSSAVPKHTPSPPTPSRASEFVNDGARLRRRRRRARSRSRHTRRLWGSTAPGPRLRRGRRRGPSVPPAVPAPNDADERPPGPHRPGDRGPSKRSKRPGDRAREASGRS